MMGLKHLVVFFITAIFWLVSLDSKGELATEPNSLQQPQFYQLHENSENHLKAALINVLQFADTLTYNEPYLTIDTSFKQTKVLLRPVGKKSLENELLVYPNPARSYIIVDYSKVDFDEEAAVLSIYTIEGKPKEVILINSVSGFKVVDTRMWTPGTYLISLNVGGKIIGSGTVLLAP